MEPTLQQLGISRALRLMPMSVGPAVLVFGIPVGDRLNALIAVQVGDAPGRPAAYYGVLSVLPEFATWLSSRFLRVLPPGV